MAGLVPAMRILGADMGYQLRWRMMVAALAIAILPSGGCTQTGNNTRTVTVGMNDGLRVEERLIPQLEIEAAKGSGEAAQKLAQHYRYYAQEYERGTYWASIAAENGDVKAMYNYAILLQKRKDAFSKERAKFWFRKVIKGAEEPYASEAERALKQLSK